MAGRSEGPSIGLGVGGVIFDARGRVFLARRGPRAGNERGRWEFPGGRVAFGEGLHAALKREIAEEHGMTIELRALLAVHDHLLPEEGQHWVAAAFLARRLSGRARIREPGKCDAIGWFDLAELPEPLSRVSWASRRVMARLRSPGAGRSALEQATERELARLIAPSRSPVRLPPAPARPDAG